jgi:DNA-binding transcriptional MerR regulator
MTLSHEPLWTLDELSAHVASALAVDYSGQASGRVREVPDIRTIRYYTTLGLIDRPAQMRGRTALYGRRHLLQLVAIKRLQAKGLSLTEVQSRVVGQTDSALRRLSQLPAGFPQPETEEAADRHPREPRAEDRRGDRFWAAAPAGESATPQAEEPKDNRGRNVSFLVGVALDAGVTLLLEGGRSLDENDVEALRSAAAPMLKILRNRRLLDAEGQAPSGKPKGDSP